MTESGPEQQRQKLDKIHLGKRFMAILMDRVGKYQDMSAEVSQKTREELFLDERMGLDVLVETVQEMLTTEQLPDELRKTLRGALMDIGFSDPVVTVSSLKDIAYTTGVDPEVFLKNKIRIYVENFKELTDTLQVMLPQELALEIEKRKDDWLQKYLGQDLQKYLES